MILQNKIVDSGINRELHVMANDAIKKANDASAQTLKILTTVVGIFSNLSITKIPKIIKDLAGLANPVADAVIKTTEAQLAQLKHYTEIPKIDNIVNLLDLSKENPIKDIKITPVDKFNTIN